MKPLYDAFTTGSAANEWAGKLKTQGQKRLKLHIDKGHLT